MGLDTYFYRTNKSNVGKDFDPFKTSCVEVAYFRKFWGLLNFFPGYQGCEYIEVSRETIDSLCNLAKKLIKMLEKTLTDNGWIIEHSPLCKDSNGDWYHNFELENGLFTESLEEMTDNVCYEVFDCGDAFITYKVISLYQSFKDILDNTNWDTDSILMESDW